MTEEDKKNLGPLAFLVGNWEADKGVDIAPSADRGVDTNKYREEMSFEPTGRVDNHEQTLYGLRYATKAYRLGEDQPYHEELGFWMWDAENKQVTRNFIIPRIIAVIAGGTVEADAKEFDLAAEYGSQTYGCLNGPFLDKEFRTVKYTLNVKQIDEDTFAYDELAEMVMPGRDEPFMHRDSNTMKRMK